MVIVQTKQFHQILQQLTYHTFLRYFSNTCLWWKPQLSDICLSVHFLMTWSSQNNLYKDKVAHLGQKNIHFFLIQIWSPNIWLLFCLLNPLTSLISCDYFSQEFNMTEHKKAQFLLRYNIVISWTRNLLFSCLSWIFPPAMICDSMQCSYRHSSQQLVEIWQVHLSNNDEQIHPGL